MRVTFTKHERRYAVYVSRDHAVDLSGGGVGYDDWLPHDLLHFVIEAELGLDDGIFGVLAAGRPVKIFIPVDPKVTAKIWRQNRIKRVKVPEGRRSEELVAEVERGWKAHTLDEPLQRKLDGLARQWHALAPGGSLTLEWPRPEGAKRHTPGRGSPATRGRVGSRRSGTRFARG